MLIERALRERTSALQSGPNDIGLFGATSQTFSSTPNAAPQISDLGPATGKVEAGAIAVEGDAFGSQVLDFQVAAQTSGTISTALNVPNVGVQVGAIVAQKAAAPTALTDGAGSAFVAMTSGSFAVIPQASVTVSAQSSRLEQVQTVAVTGEATVQQASIAAPAVAVIDDVQAGAGAITAKLGEIEASIAQARADALEQIEQIAATATTQVAAIQAKLAETIAGVGDKAANLVTEPGEILNEIIAPVLDLVADIPGTIKADIAATIDAGADATIQLGETQVAIGEQLAVAADLALDADLPLDGADVAGGVATLITMVNEDAGYIIEDVAAGIAFPLAPTAPLETVDALIDLPSDLLGEDGLGASDGLLGQFDAGGALLGTGEHDPLHGLLDTGDFGLGLG